MAAHCDAPAVAVSATFDPEVASAYGIATGRTDLILCYLAGNYGAGLDSDPRRHFGCRGHGDSTGHRPLFTKRFQTLLFVSPLIGIFCSAVGMYLSFYLDISSAATIVLTAAAFFFFLEILSWFRRQQRTRHPPLSTS